jgi:hypothetical protein
MSKRLAELAHLHHTDSKMDIPLDNNMFYLKKQYLFVEDVETKAGTGNK